MRIGILTSVRLMGESLDRCLSARDDIVVVKTVEKFSALREVLSTADIDLVLVDVTQGIDLDEVRALAVDYPNLTLLALGLREHRSDVIRHGRAGFSGYIPRDASIDDLCKSIFDAIKGSLVCPPEISGGLMRGLFRMEPPSAVPENIETLTRREEEVLRLIGNGLSNKEIAAELFLSVATVKQHVHKILTKLRVPRRVQAMRQVRDMPWLAPASSDMRKT